MLANDVEGVVGGAGWSVWWLIFFCDVAWANMYLERVCNPQNCRYIELKGDIDAAAGTQRECVSCQRYTAPSYI